MSLFYDILGNGKALSSMAERRALNPFILVRIQKGLIWANGLMVRISGFQSEGSGSIPGWPIFELGRKNGFECQRLSDS